MVKTVGYRLPTHVLRLQFIKYKFHFHLNINLVTQENPVSVMIKNIQV